jgi:hypothetical protein
MKTPHRSRTLSLAAGVASLVLVGSSPSSVGSAEEPRDAAGPVKARAEEPAPRAAPPAATPSQKQATSPVLYVPPEIGFPGRRIGAGTRGMGRLASLQILAPDHLAYTTLEQPTLYWYLAEPTATRIDFTLRDETSVEPLVDLQLPAPAQPGIQALRLADHGVRLLPGVRYLWFVSLVSDPDRRSRDFAVGAWIALRVPDAALRERLANADGHEGPIYAASGLWYDAIGAFSSRIAASPADPMSREQRAALLDQVGLSEVAAYDRERAAER